MSQLGQSRSSDQSASGISPEEQRIYIERLREQGEVQDVERGYDPATLRPDVTWVCYPEYDANGLQVCERVRIS